MTRKRGKNPELEVFSGREAKLNRVIFLVLNTKDLLTSYDMYLELKQIKDFRHIKWQSVDRRMKALCAQSWIIKCGVRPAKAHFLSPFYTLSIRAKVAFALNKTDLNIFIQVAKESDLEIVLGVLSMYL